MNFKAFLTALVVLTAVVNAGLYSASNHVDAVSNRNSQLTFWFDSTNQATFAVNVEGVANAYATPSVGVIDAGAVKSFAVTFNPPTCSDGTFYATVNVDLATPNSVERLSKIIELNIERGVDCGPVVLGTPETLVVDEAASSISLSRLSLQNRFDASEVNVVIYSDEGGIRNIANGEARAIEITVVNRGAPGLFRANLVADPGLGATLSEYSFILERSEVKNLRLLIVPQSTEGRKFVGLQVTRSGQVAAVKDIYVDIANNHELALSIPQLARINNCGVNTLAGTGHNTGSSQETVILSIPALSAVSNEVTLEPRTASGIVLNIDASRLLPGTRMYEVVLASERASSKQVVRFEVEDCEAQGVVYSVTVANTGNETLAGVHAVLENVPDFWIVALPSPLDIAPGEEKELSLTVTPQVQRSADVLPVLVVRDENGREIKREPLGTIKANTPISGLFLAGVFGLSGLQWIAVVLLIALVIAVMSARAALSRTSS
ncbi:hypothetical protein HY571_02715 [Candidatus Micrarchaeota archaeon]|nr:hypothetical protein [Candidatus Micrarchaeota archaeon]